MVIKRVLTAWFRQALDLSGEFEHDDANMLAARALLPSLAALTCSDIASLSSEYGKLADAEGYPKGYPRHWPERSAVEDRRRMIAYEASAVLERTLWGCGERSEILWVDAEWGPALSAAYDGVLARAAADQIPLEIREAMAAPLLTVIPGLPILDE